MRPEEHAPQRVVAERLPAEDAAAAHPGERGAPIPLLLRAQGGLLQLEAHAEGAEWRPARGGCQGEDGPPRRPPLPVRPAAGADPAPPAPLLQVHVRARPHGAPALGLPQQVRRDRVLPEEVRRRDRPALPQGPRQRHEHRRGRRDVHGVRALPVGRGLGPHERTLDAHVQPVPAVCRNLRLHWVVRAVGGRCRTCPRKGGRGATPAVPRAPVLVQAGHQRDVALLPVQRTAEAAARAAAQVHFRFLAFWILPPQHNRRTLQTLKQGEQTFINVIFRCYLNM